MAFKKHDRFFVVVMVEVCSWDIDGGYVALFLCVNGGCNNDAIRRNGWGSTVFFPVSRLGAFLAAVCNCLRLDSVVSFFDNVHE